MSALVGELLKPTLPPLIFDESLSFAHPLTIEALAYWRALLKGRTMPSRADLEPGKMRKFLPHVTLIEPRMKSDGTRDYCVRLMGSACEQVFGLLPKTPIREFLPPEIEIRWRTMLDRALLGKGPRRTIGRVAYRGKLWLTSENLIVPLGDDDETVSMLMVVLVTWESGEEPRFSAGTS